MQAVGLRSSEPLNLKAGQLIEVRGPEEILATLDDRCELDCLPFMPEMLQYCGRRFTVASVATKLCDTMTRSGMRRMHNAVHLVGVRCDGQAHGGCQASCLMYWKEAWLKPVASATSAQPVPTPPDASRVLPILVAASRRLSSNGGEAYSCQATELLRAAPERLPVRDLAQYVRDVRSRNVGVLSSARALFVGLFNRYQHLSGRILPRPLLIRGGRQWRFLKGTADKTPNTRTDLQVGELVRIKSKDEIMKTLNADLLNRGMGFDAEMSRFCGQIARVARRVDRIINERTGEMLEMRNPCIVLEGVFCEGVYNGSCPRAIPPYWREVWLERIADPTAGAEDPSGQTGRTSAPSST
jgi:hypothetical protein